MWTFRWINLHQVKSWNDWQTFHFETNIDHSSLCHILIHATFKSITNTFSTWQRFILIEVMHTVFIFIFVCVLQKIRSGPIKCPTFRAIYFIKCEILHLLIMVGGHQSPLSFYLSANKPVLNSQSTKEEKIYFRCFIHSIVTPI